MDDKPDNIPGPPDFVERRSGTDRRDNKERRGSLRWDPRPNERRNGWGRRKSDKEQADDKEPE